MQELEYPSAGPSERHEAMPEAKRRVHAAGLECFGRYGRAGARIDEIVRLSKVNVRMIYHYYGSKDGLYDAILNEVYTSRASFLRGAKSDSVEWDLPQIVRAILSWQASERTQSRILDWEACEDWRGSHAAVEACLEAPNDIAPVVGSADPVTVFRRIHTLTSPWARLAGVPHGFFGQQGQCSELLIAETVKCFAADAG